MDDRAKRPMHTVVQYNYTMEGSRTDMMNRIRHERTIPFEKIISTCENRLHAIFLFLSILELVQMGYMHLFSGEGKNNFILEFNETATEGMIINPEG